MMALNTSLKLLNATNIAFNYTQDYNITNNETTLDRDFINFSNFNNGSSENNTMVFAGPPEPASMETIVLLSMLFIIIGTVGLIGNSLVIIVILFDRKMRQSLTNIFIMNLAVADFVIMLVGIPEIVQFMMNRGWLLGAALCKVNRFILVVSLYVSILSLVSVCIERFVAIVYPLKAHILCGRRKIVFAILFIWPTSLACGLPTAIFNTLKYPHPSIPYKHCINTFPERQYQQFFEYMQFAFFYFIPVTVQVILYAVIGKKLYASTEELHARFQMRKETRPKHDKTSDTIKARKDVVKMLASSVLVYIVCYAPPQILLFYNTFSPKPFQGTWSFLVFSIVISNVNSAANPILYSIFSQNFRKNFKKYLCYLCLPKPSEYQRAGQDISESRYLSRKISSTISRSTTFSKV
ncbi:neuropeptide receptor 15-like [Ruditapes philippinarum]|uniref:neuropeptide receptor 15-like n=1 Tax=Ruditapes philippinarum TaxID=129788 RepID=UPI00295C09D9|nr:neuropeptide receptor 15-like [Ruditapes philippinarum]